MTTTFKPRTEPPALQRSLDDGVLSLLLMARKPLQLSSLITGMKGCATRSQVEAAVNRLAEDGYAKTYSRVGWGILVVYAEPEEAR